MRFSIIVGGALLAAAIGCGPPEGQRLTCSDLMPRRDSNFRAVTALMIDADAGGKGCAFCHNTDFPVFGYNFEKPGVTYDALVSKIDTIYTQLATGAMPQDGDVWAIEDLRLLRSWYCHGAIYED